MSATLAPFGFLPSYHETGLERAKKRTIASGYGTNIFKNSPVILNTNGTVTAGTAAADLLGVFVGVDYIDSTGKPTYSTFWPAGTVATLINAWVVEDPKTIYHVQADGTVAQSAVGDEVDMTNVGAGSTANGLSTCTVSATPAGAGVQGQFRIVGFANFVDNAAGDAFPILEVEIARLHGVSNKVAV